MITVAEQFTITLRDMGYGTFLVSLAGHGYPIWKERAFSSSGPCIVEAVIDGGEYRDLIARIYR